MKRTTRSIQRNMARILTLLVAAAVFAMSAVSVFAADKEYTLYGSFAPGESEGYPIAEQPTEFSLYRVGGFDGSKLKLDKDYGVEININIEKPEDADTDETVRKEWTEEWMTSAQTLADYVRTDDEQSPVATATTDADGNFTMSGLINGLYLLLGTSQKYEDPSTGTTYYWWPRPMYVLILDGDVEMEVKPGKELVNKFIVRKTWVGDEEYKDEIRPDSIEIEICYDGEPVYNETLSSENDWSFRWETGQDDNDPSKWTVTEQMTDGVKANYTVTKDVSYTEGSDDENGCGYVTLTNTNKYEPPEEPDNPDEKPKTGDDSRTGTLITVNVIALLLLVITVSIRRRHRSTGAEPEEK